MGVEKGVSASVRINRMAGGVLSSSSGGSEGDELRHLIDSMVARATPSGAVPRVVRQPFDTALWDHLQGGGLTRLTSADAGPMELAIVLHALARHCAAVPIAETDVLG